MIHRLLAETLIAGWNLAGRVVDAVLPAVPHEPPITGEVVLDWDELLTEYRGLLEAANAELQQVRDVLTGTGHVAMADLARSVDTAIDRERQRKDRAVAGIALAAGWTQLDDTARYEPASVAAYVGRVAGERDGLARRADGPAVCQLDTVAEHLGIGQLCGGGPDLEPWQGWFTDRDAIGDPDELGVMESAQRDAPSTDPVTGITGGEPDGVVEADIVDDPAEV